MSSDAPPPSGAVVVRYWAGARAAAGRAEDLVPAGTLDEVLRAVLSQHPGNARLHRIVPICSVLLGEDPVGARDHASVRVADGSVVELLPPFAGGSETHVETFLHYLRRPAGPRSHVATVDPCVRPG